ncbi:hypothetical protein GCM10022251_45460 [Phytohabitans flavus]|uniref:Uncharacterized protein n=1 Tax=Phytohabitans flavus TaxID=1076124 RepID=A0A6F8Y815_9ACTN|nr:hypothetical protein Pflav_085110 [Phytohabitans flavus]
MRNSREHTLNYSACLIHARNNDDQFLLDRSHRVGRHQLTMGSGLVSAALRARVQLDDALKLMDPYGAEALCSVRLLQTHESTVPEGSIKCA